MMLNEMACSPLDVANAVSMHLGRPLLLMLLSGSSGSSVGDELMTRNYHITGGHV
jgi:hypothetical protein